MARLISFFLIFALFLAFIVLNLDNKCSIGFGFYTFNDVPIYISVFISIFLGLLLSMPVLASFKKKKDESGPNSRPGKKNKKHSENFNGNQGENEPYGIN